MTEATVFSDDDARRMRVCANCGNLYSIGEHLTSHYFEQPYNYSRGCVTRCLGCWLGCGPEPDGLEGDVLREVGGLGPETHLVIMPITRVFVSSPLALPKHTNIYPRGKAKTEMLNVLPYDRVSKSLAAFQSDASGVNEKTLKKHVTIAFPCSFSWDALWRMSFKDHMEFIRQLSDVADTNCLNLIRYRLCSIETADTLPSRAGQISTDHMMAGALLYNALRAEARIIGGDAFSHIVTKGLGLPIDDDDLGPEEFPGDGETGHLAQHGLSLYSAMLQNENPTAKFVQALALLEFLAEPGVYTRFKDVSRIIARYIAKNNVEYKNLLDRFFELTGKNDPVTGSALGYRTKIIHLGHKLETIVPIREERLALFKELDHYIRTVLDHMIAHSHVSYGEYLEIRSQMEDFRR